MRSRNRVVFPAPFGPSRPQICPGGIEKERFLRAILEPKDFVTRLICTRLAIGGGSAQHSGREPAVSLFS
jgi:hypothetical protein